MKYKFILPLALLMGSIFAKAQTASSNIDHSYKPMTLKLDDKGTKYIRFITWHQVWGTSTANNPGTLDVNGKTTTTSNNLAIRRSRFLVQAQVSPRYLIVSHFGINNQSFINGGSAGTNGVSNAGKKPQLYIHDAWNEFAVVPGQLHIGAGLHYWNGVSRLANSSTLNMMTMDAPIFNWFNIEATDQFARQFGIYAKGQIEKFDYRINLNKPFLFGVANNSAITSKYATNVYNESWSTGGYFNYNFFDKESNVLPYMVGTYLGTKKIVNVGAGYNYAPNATASRAKLTDSVTTHNQSNLGVDVFVDMPIKNSGGLSISGYSSFTHHNFGPGYLRALGILNEHASVQPVATNADASYYGGGNLQPTIGTGNIWYTHLGVLLPKNSKGGAFMPYATYTYKNFERIGSASSQFDLGCNYFIAGHNAKITAQYGTRPVYKAVTTNGVTTPERNGSKGEFVIQSHIFL